VGSWVVMKSSRSGVDARFAKCSSSPSGGEEVLSGRVLGDV
jgi:hypothetical protein